MALEAATTINQLRDDYPTGLDPKSQGDDHIRLIKASLKRTFPAVAGVVTVSHEQINKVADLTQYVQPGMVVMWPYSIGTIPAGWRVCNGVGEVTGGRLVPNLIDRFLVGAGYSYAVGAVGGSATHSHGITIAGHALTLEQIPPHSHLVGVGPYTPPGIDTVGSSLEPRNVMNFPGTYENWSTSSAGTGNSHSHGASSAIVNHLPPYYAILYIIKV